MGCVREHNRCRRTVSTAVLLRAILVCIEVDRSDWGVMIIGQRGLVMMVLLRTLVVIVTMLVMVSWLRRLRNGDGRRRWDDGAG